MHLRTLIHALGTAALFLAPATSSEIQRVLAPQNHVTDSTQSSSQGDAKAAAQPFYIISHRTLTVNGVLTALKDGANAIEIDATSFEGGWRADHDNTPLFGSVGDDMRTMFEAVANQRRMGKAITFVWLDIKNPDRCSPESQRHCSILGLQDLARELLEPVDVQVLYGISQEGPAIQHIGRSLNDNEAIRLDCEAGDVYRLADSLPEVQKSHIIYSCGLFWLGADLLGSRKGKIHEALRSGRFGKTFAWTILSGDEDYIAELGGAGIDGMIYGGVPANAYAEVSWFRPNQRNKEQLAVRQIEGWVQSRHELRYKATQSDKAW